MMFLAKSLAAVFGIGKIKGGGTVAALITCIIWYAVKIYSFEMEKQLALVAVVFFVGVFTATVVEKDWGYDSNKVVIDEVLGMSIALFMLPFSFWHFAGAFILFRFFDIVKPLFIRRAEKLNGGWGVMLDDALAGIYSSLTLQLLLIIF